MAAPRSSAGRPNAAHETPTAQGYLHEVGFYASDEEFRDLICPFALDGTEAGEPVVFAYDPHKVNLLRRWLPYAPSISYVTDAGSYATPAKAIVTWRKLVEGHLAAGAPRVRIAGNVPHPGYGQPFAGWDRYEAAIDWALGDLPVWAPCLYDARITPAEILDTAARLHHHILDAGGVHHPNGSFETYGRLADFLTPAPDPLEETVPTLELIDPKPAQARAATGQLVEGVVGAELREELVLGVSEAVTNALIHGVSPISLRIWLATNRAVINVHDKGQGPIDPLAGLLPLGTKRTDSGRGLWLTHQLNIDAALIITSDGFTVRLRADCPHR